MDELWFFGQPVSPKWLFNKNSGSTLPFIAHTKIKFKNFEFWNYEFKNYKFKFYEICKITKIINFTNSENEITKWNYKIYKIKLQNLEISEKLEI